MKAWIQVALVAGAVGCTVQPLEVTGLLCPCPEGYVCLGDGATCEEEPTCEGEFKVSALEVEWTTERVLAIRWGVDSTEELFDEYRVELRSENRDLVVDRSVNPELGEFQRSRTTDVVDGTWLRGLSPNTAYVVRLIARDTAGGECGLIARGRTRRGPNGEVVWLEGGERPEEVWVSHPECTTEVGDALRMTVRCVQVEDPQSGELTDSHHCVREGPTTPNCNANMVMGDFTQEFSSSFRFDDAFVEFTISATGEGHISSDWSLVGLRLRREDPSMWFANGYTIPIGQGRQTFQVPLAEFQRDGRKMRADDIAGIAQLLIGGHWPDGMFFELEDARLVW